MTLHHWAAPPLPITPRLLAPLPLPRLFQLQLQLQFRITTNSLDQPIAVAESPKIWTFSNDYLEEQTGIDLDDNGVIGDGTAGNAGAPSNLNALTYGVGDCYHIDGSLVSLEALDSVKSFFNVFNAAAGISLDATNAYTCNNFSDTAANLSAALKDIGNITGTLTVTDPADSPASLSTLETIKSNFTGSTFIYNGVEGTSRDLAEVEAVHLIGSLISAHCLVLSRQR